MRLHVSTSVKNDNQIHLSSTEQNPNVVEYSAVLKMSC